MKENVIIAAAQTLANISLD